MRQVYEFQNGWALSVVSDEQFIYADFEFPYEVALMHNGEIEYGHPIAPDGVRGYLTAEDVADILQEVKALPRT